MRKLAEQWQDELYQRFHLPFDILTNDKLEAARTGNWFLETNLAIARLDKLSRNEDVQLKLQLQQLIEERALAHDAMDASRVYRSEEFEHQAQGQIETRSAAMEFFENKENDKKISKGLLGMGTQIPSPSPDPFSC